MASTLIGGDTTRGPLNLCVTILGEVPAGTALTRGGRTCPATTSRVGPLGDAALALADTTGSAHSMPRRDRALRARLERPEPRASRWARSCAELAPARSMCPTA